MIGDRTPESIAVALAVAAGLVAGCGESKKPKVDAATEQREALERAKKGPYGTQVQSLETAKKRGAKPLARIVAYASNAHEPEWFTTAPVGAIEKVLKKAGWKASEVDLFEVNEAFAVVAMAAMKDVGIPAEKVNVNGGAVALGHPIGATGARIITTLIYALKKRNLKKGVAALCIGGGEGTALALEVM